VGNTERGPRFRNIRRWRAGYSGNFGYASAACHLVGAVIAKDFPSVKDSHQMR
jgi:hypothetical protein